MNLYQECVYLVVKALEAALVLTIVIFPFSSLRPSSTNLKYLSIVKVTTTNTCLSALEYSIPHSANTTVGD
jgi:ABC-type sulfate transport system permease component